MKIIYTLKKHAILLITITILLAGTAAYINSLPNKFLWDDNQAIVTNLHIRDWKYFPNFFTESISTGSGFPSNYWRPMILSVYTTEWHLWEYWEPGYHMVNIFFHLASAVLVFFFLYFLFRKRIPAAIAALFFVVHPLQTEAVTFISGLADPLSLFFMLAGLIFLLRARKVIPSKSSVLLNYFFVFLTFILALLTKERSVVFPAVFLLVDIFIWKTRETSTISLKQFLKLSSLRVLPFICGSALYLFLRATILNLQNTFNIYGVVTEYTAHFSVRLFTFLKISPSYFSLLFWPAHLQMERSNAIIPATSFFEPLVLMGTIIIILLVMVIVNTWKKAPEYSFGVLWFLVLLFPSSGILVPVAGIIYEHYLYAPLIGLAFIFGLAWYSFYKKANLSWRYFLLTLLVILLALSIRQSARRNLEWRDEITFYTNTLQYSPKSLQMNNNLGLAYINKGDFPAAEKVYLTAIKFNPFSPEPHHNLGNLYYRTGRLNEAIQEYQAALKILPNSMSYRALYQLYLDKGEPQKAEMIRQDSIIKQ